MWRHHKTKCLRNENRRLPPISSSSQSIPKKWSILDHIVGGSVCVCSRNEWKPAENSPKWNGKAINRRPSQQFSSAQPKRFCWYFFSASFCWFRRDELEMAESSTKLSPFAVCSHYLFLCKIVECCTAGFLRFMLTFARTLAALISDAICFCFECATSATVVSGHQRKIGWAPRKTDMIANAKSSRCNEQAHHASEQWAWREGNRIDRDAQIIGSIHRHRRTYCVFVNIVLLVVSCRQIVHSLSIHSLRWQRRECVVFQSWQMLAATSAHQDLV